MWLHFDSMSKENLIKTKTCVFITKRNMDTVPYLNCIILTNDYINMKCILSMAKAVHTDHVAYFRIKCNKLMHSIFIESIE